MSDKDERAQAVAVNESRFREINDRAMAELVRVVQDDEELEFVCECALLDCRAVARLTAAEYETVRSDPHHFAIVPGHEIPRYERLVGGCNPRYAVVEKCPEVWDVVEETNPRDEQAA